MLYQVHLVMNGILAHTESLNFILERKVNNTKNCCENMVLIENEYSVLVKIDLQIWSPHFHSYIVLKYAVMCLDNILVYMLYVFI
jgi:hypothetical protein